MVKFGLNGSDAGPAAVRLARAYQAVKWLPYTGTSRSSRPTAGYRDHAHVGRHSCSDQASYRSVLLQDLADLGRLFDTYPGQIAAVIMEAETVQPPALAASTACAVCAIATGAAHPWTR